MRRLVWLALLVSGCLVRDPELCDHSYPSCPSGQACDFKHDKCVAILDGGGDGGEDLGVGDLAERDARMADGSSDLARECDASTQCGDPSHPVCGGGSCRACVAGDDSQCQEHAGSPYCEADAGRCVQCTVAAEAVACPSPMPICDSSACRACIANDECASGVCKPGGACAGASEIAYVDNGGKAPAACKLLDGGTRDGSKALPYCNIQDGIVDGRPFVRVAGSTAPYDAISVTTSLSVTVVGPGLLGQPAIVLSSVGANSNVSIQVGGGLSASLTLIGIQVGKPGTSSTQDNIVCIGNLTGTVALTLKNGASYQAGASAHGVKADNCTITLDSDRIAFNAGGGITLLDSTHYQITNNLIYNNSGGPAVQINAAASGFFQLNTIADNTAPSGVAGIDCDTTPQPIEGCILWNNTVAAALMEQASCHLIDSDADAIDPLFVNEAGYDFHIGNNALTNVIARPVDGGAPTLPDHDFFGTFRPLGGAWDVGAHEKQ